MKREKFNGFIEFAQSGLLIESTFRVRVRAQIGPKTDLKSRRFSVMNMLLSISDTREDQWFY